MNPRTWLPILLALAVALALHLHLLTALDLRDTPGPGGVMLVRDLVTDQNSLGWCTRLGAWLMPFTGGDPLLAARLLVSGASMLALARLAVCTWVIAGPTAAACAALVFGLWAPAAGVAWTWGPDNVSWGVAWIGAAFCWLAGHRRSPWLAGVGMGIVVIGAAVKANALPVIGFAGLGLLLAPRSEWARLILGATLGGAAMLPTAWFGLNADEPWLGGVNRRSSEESQWGAFDVVSGMNYILTLPDRYLPQGHFRVVFALAALGVVVPGPRRCMRVTLFVVGLLGLAVIGRTTGMSMQPRYLVHACLGHGILIGIGLGWVADRLRGAGWIPVLALAGLAAADTLAFADGWHRQRAEFLMVKEHALVEAPARLRAQYDQLNRAIFMESSQQGVIELYERARAAPTEGFATTRIRDRREFHGEVGAGVAGIPYRLLNNRDCCPRGSDATCAQQVLDGVNQSGALLMLPMNLEGISSEEAEWIQQLARSAEGMLGAPGTKSDWWASWQGRQTGGDLPCSPRGR